MANRSDEGSDFPRKLKRFLSLMSTLDDKQDRIVRKMFIEVHKHSKDVKNKRAARRDVHRDDLDEGSAT